MVPAQAIPSALRDLFETMDSTVNPVPPIIMLQILHMAFPQFAEKSEHGGYTQQVITVTGL